MISILTLQVLEREIALKKILVPVPQITMEIVAKKPHVTMWLQILQLFVQDTVHVHFTTHAIVYLVGQVSIVQI